MPAEYQRDLGLYRATGEVRGHLMRFERIDERPPEFTHERVLWLDTGRRYPAGTVGWVCYLAHPSRAWHTFSPLDGEPTSILPDRELP